MLGRVPSFQKNLGAPLRSRKAMLETLFRHLDMVRLSAAGVLMMTLVGCVGLIDGGSDGLTTQQRNARTKWQSEAYPVLRDNCAACHNGSRAMIGFLIGGESLAIRDTLMKYDPAVVNLEAPSSSRMLTKGQHDGPQLTAEQASALLQWLNAERDATNHDPDHPVPVLATKKYAVQLCQATAADPTAPCPVNHVPLSDIADVGTTVPGAEITFLANGLSSGLYLHDLNVTGGTAGVYMEHLLFVSLPASMPPFPDQIDRYFATKLNVKPGETVPLNGGTEQFGGFAAGDMIEVHFRVLSPFKPDTGGGGTTNNGCKALALFKTNVVPQLQLAGTGNVNCASCHGGADVAAKQSMDITGFNSATEATQLNACNQVRSRINLTNTNQSGFYLAPDPASATNHPVKFAAANFTSFKTMMDAWVQAEKTAP
jgi:mono/diheme cytochrome c family protein